MKKLLNFIKKLFGGGNTSPAPQRPVEPVITPPYQQGSKKKIAICLGHSFTGADKGAVGNGTSEVEYNTWVMDYIDVNSKENVKTFRGSSSLTAANAGRSWGADVVLQLHLNSYNGSAHGCEVLVIKNDTKSYPLAEKFAHDFTTRFGRTKRRPEAKGKKILEVKDRGVASLVASGSAVKMLCEPFFIDNKSDFVPREEYAKFLVDFLKEV